MSWSIAVVDQNRKKWPPAKGLVAVGVPLKVAAEWEKIRRQMSPAGLRRKVKENRN